MATGKMYECDVKVLYKVGDRREYRWETRPVERVFKDSDVRCCHCHGEVRLHRKGVAHGPADHVEHKLSADADHCRGGHKFKASEQEHRMSQFPVT